MCEDEIMVNYGIIFYLELHMKLKDYKGFRDDYRELLKLSKLYLNKFSAVKQDIYIYRVPV